MCGLFGYSDYGHKVTTRQINDLIDALSTESAARGTDAVGIAYSIDGKLEIEKEAKSAYTVTFKLPKDTRAVIGHTRHSTQGSCKKRYNNHPFRGRLKEGGMFALAHNGIIGNDRELKKSHKLPETKIETDSYIAVQLLEQELELSFDVLRDMAESLRGSYTFSILDDQNNTYLIKGDNPLSILHFTQLGLFVYASTDQILWRALASSMLRELKASHYEEIKIDGGQILKISPSGKLSCGNFNLQAISMDGLYNWWDHGYTKREIDDADRAAYMEELKSVASAFGYSPDDVEYLVYRGYSCEEIEEIFCGYDDDCSYALAR